LLPWAGKGAIALPTDLGQAARLPVTAAALPFSREGLQLRELRRALHRCHVAENSEARSREWRSLAADHYRPMAHRIAARPQPTWADCVELAEICWQALDKEMVKEEGRETGALSVRQGDFGPGAYWCREAIVALVEAVLTLGNGERFDPKTQQGHWPQAVQCTDLGGGRCGPAQPLGRLARWPLGRPQLE
jgi:hypothetical protein